MPGSFDRFILLFGVYSFLGWVLEFAYRSIRQRRFANPGFLQGPFVPLYGFGAAFAAGVDMLLPADCTALRLAAFFLFLSALEYAAGWLMERIFNVKLWDYSDTRFHLHGRVSLTFSLAWTTLAWAFVAVIHPFFLARAQAMPDTHAQAAAVALVLLFAFDLILSAGEVEAFGDLLVRFREGLPSVRKPDLDAVMARFARLRLAFPHLNQQLQAVLQRSVPDSWREQWRTGYRRIRENIESRRPLEEEFNDIVADILNHPEFLRLKDFRHHTSSIYDHALAVSFLSYRICKQFGLDYRSAARGGLLHDFFLYDWRNHDVPDLPREKFHGLEHPRIALENARRHFAINDIERDCILRHMWPLTLTPPRFMESFVVCMADKYVASREYLVRRGSERR